MGPIPTEELPPLPDSMPFFVPGQGDTHPLQQRMHVAGPDERRQCFRRELCCDLQLIDNVMSDPAARKAIPGRCLDISDAGLYATIPLGYGVTIGQRYTFRIMVPERGPEPGAVQIVAQQGVIVRTELLVGCDELGDRLGIGVRLTGHRSGVVPMPAW